MINSYGIGLDVHKLKEGGDLILGGIIISKNYSLEGDSDADVLTHAIIDSLLGAANLGDMGHFFNDSTELIYSSLQMLKKTDNIIKQNGWIINNIDSTIICEKFKIFNYSNMMKSKISETLKLDANKINIKGKSTDGLGFIGKNEGISALAICSMYKKQ